MAKRNPPTPTYTNPDVRFERSDIEASGIVRFGLFLVLGLLSVLVLMLWLGRTLLAEHRKPDPLQLPRASVDTDRGLPEPRLEAVEDVRSGNVRLFPSRASEYLRPQREQLDRIEPGKKLSRIEASMDAMTRTLPVRKSGDRTPPKRFTIRLPSKSSAGRTETGGQ